MKQSRKRYLMFRLHMDGPPIAGRQLTHEIWRSFQSLFGEVETSDARLFLNEYDEKTGIGYLQCNMSSLENVITAAALIESIDRTRVSFEPKRASGTIKSLLRRKSQ
ncbi:MAG: Rpp14/Pop5 family protein [Candidatus Thorarchaeota archaeon]